MAGLSLTGCAIDTGIGEVHEAVQVKKAEFMLTFDDGPTPDFTGRVLDALATLQVSDGTPVIAGFFLVADAPESFWQRRYHYAPYELWTRKGSLTEYPDMARRIQMDGHVIGNHSTHHAWFLWPWLNTQEAVLAELTRWEDIATPIIGAPAERLFRPPYFINTATAREVAQRQGYQIVMGESAGDASPFASLATVMNRTTAILANWDKPYPCVLVFHDIRPATYEHLAEIVANLQQHGFQLVHFDPARL
jgi:peptidoglycan-N-acetylglucosamine deacetylase